MPDATERDWLGTAQRAFEAGMEAWHHKKKGSHEEATVCFQAAMAACAIGRELAAQKMERQMVGLHEMAKAAMQQASSLTGAKAPAHALPFDPSDNDATQEPEP